MTPLTSVVAAILAFLRQRIRKLTITLVPPAGTSKKTPTSVEFFLIFSTASPLVGVGGRLASIGTT